MFHVNEKLIHPKFGACKLVKVEEKVVLEKCEECLVLIPLFDNPTNLTITVPLRSIRIIGLRRPLDSEAVKKVKELLLTKPDRNVLQTQTNTPFIKEKIHSGEVIKIAEALRDLFFKNRVENGKYSNVNRRTMFTRAFKMLATELAISLGVSIEEAGNWINSALEKHRQIS